MSDDKIRERAYALWEADGYPDGRDQEYWHRAKSELESELSGSLDDQLDDSFPASDPPSMTDPSDHILPKAPEDEAKPARSASLEERPKKAKVPDKGPEKIKEQAKAKPAEKPRKPKA